MKSRFVFVVFAGTLFGVLIFSSCLDSMNKENGVRRLSAGELYDRNCSICHGPHGEGKQLGNQLIPSLNAAHARSLTDERINWQITNGGGGMPPFKYTLDDEQVRGLVKFIRREIQEQ